MAKGASKISGSGGGGGKFWSDAKIQKELSMYDFDVSDPAFISQMGYTGGRKAALINNALRSGNVPSDLQKNIDFIDNHMRPISSPIDTIRVLNDFGGAVPMYANTFQQALGVPSAKVYAAINSNDVSGLNNAIGNVVSSKAYTSTSYDPSRNVTSGVVKMKIHAPAGTKGLITDNSSESEIIWHRNLKYKIKKFSVSNNQLVVDVDIVD